MRVSADLLSLLLLLLLFSMHHPFRRLGSIGEPAVVYVDVVFDCLSLREDKVT